LERLLSAQGPRAADQAWERFIDRYTGTVLSAVRRYAPDYDGRMDRYAYVVEELKKGDFKRLRAYALNPRGHFRTWLVVVSRRLCIDFHRRQYGRDRGGNPATREAREDRRRLMDLIVEELDPEASPDPTANNPEDQVRRREQSRALEEAMSTLDAEGYLLLQLRFRDGLSVRRIGQVMHYSSVFHVYRRLTAVLRRLRERLEEKGITEPDP
jgi:RNA polymerase sigma factor (sigma-70 family)